MDGRACSSCGENSLEPGFLEDTGQAAKGYTRWVQGPLELGPLGGARVMGKPRRTVEAWRCTTCGHLDLFAGDYA